MKLIFKKIYELWIELGHILGWINSRIILTAFFVIFFIPTAVVFKIIRRDRLRLKRQTQDTYWITVDRPFNDQFKYQF
ncbi:MAG: hypothetical protein KDD38_06920 [Bdellovibrionales bacterium]|nr:hypothetical protein [Bdellovibrionales bacterium]